MPFAALATAPIAPAISTSFAGIQTPVTVEGHDSRRCRSRADCSGVRSGGAVAISVLTSRITLGVRLRHLAAVRSATALPLLRKDFIFDEYQVYESAQQSRRFALIVAALDDDRCEAARNC